MANSVVGRTTIQGATTVGGFNPATLFSSGEQGVWYDPSDLSTMYQDSAGTIPVTGLEQPVGRILDKSGRGNHATQSTAANRPVLSARVNLLTYSQQFDNAVWTKIGLKAFGSGSVADTSATMDPIGGTTADFIQEDSTANGHGVIITSNNAIGAGTYTFSCFVKAAGRNYALLRLVQDNLGANTATAVFDLVNKTISLAASTRGTMSGASATITDAGNGWLRISLTATSPAAFYYGPGVSPADAGSPTIGAYGDYVYTGNGTSGIYIWGADLRPANQGVGLPVYQRVGAATYGTSAAAGNADYDANGFPYYLSFDGGDSLVTGSVDFSSTNKVSIVSAINKNSNSTSTGIIVELTADVNSNNGSFNIRAPANAGTGKVVATFSRGTTLVGSESSDIYAAPIPLICSGLSDISAPSVTLRVNGSQVSQSTSSQGTGNYSNAPLYIGARGGSSVYFTGNIYGLIVRGASSTANQITGAENWLNQRTGAY